MTLAEYAADRRARRGPNRNTIADLMRGDLAPSLTLSEPSVRDPADAFARLPAVRVLRRLAKGEEVETFKWQLLKILTKLDIDVPEGVLTPSPKSARRGRPPSPQTKDIYDTWVRIGQPPPYKTTLASEFYGETFRDADGPTRRGMVQKCRKAVERGLVAETRMLRDEVRRLNEEIEEQEEGTTEP